MNINRIREKKVVLISDENKINILASSGIRVRNLYPDVRLASMIKLFQPVSQLQNSHEAKPKIRIRTRNIINLTLRKKESGD